MYRNVVIVGLSAALLGAGVATLVGGGASGPQSDEGSLRLTGNALVDEQGRPVGACTRVSCNLRWPLDGGDLISEGRLDASGTGTLAVTDGTGDYRGAFGRIALRSSGPRQMTVKVSYAV